MWKLRKKKETVFSPDSKRYIFHVHVKCFIAIRQFIIHCDFREQTSGSWPQCCTSSIEIQFMSPSWSILVHPVHPSHLESFEALSLHVLWIRYFCLKDLNFSVLRCLNLLNMSQCLMDFFLSPKLRLASNPKRSDRPSGMQNHQLLYESWRGFCSYSTCIHHVSF